MFIVRSLETIQRLAVAYCVVLKVSRYNADLGQIGLSWILVIELFS